MPSMYLWENQKVPLSKKHIYNDFVESRHYNDYLTGHPLEKCLYEFAMEQDRGEVDDDEFQKLKEYVEEQEAQKEEEMQEKKREAQREEAVEPVEATETEPEPSAEETDEMESPAGFAILRLDDQSPVQPCVGCGSPTKQMLNRMGPLCGDCQQELASVLEENVASGEE